MQHKIFTALPEFLAKDAKTRLMESEINESTGLVSWPRVMLYEYKDQWGVILRTHNPPKNETSYNISILNLEAYEYLCKTGWVYDPQHTGGNPMFVDNRRAPGA